MVELVIGQENVPRVEEGLCVTRVETRAILPRTVTGQTEETETAIAMGEADHTDDHLRGTVLVHQWGAEAVRHHEVMAVLGRLSAEGAPHHVDLGDLLPGRTLPPEAVAAMAGVGIPPEATLHHDEATPRPDKVMEAALLQEAPMVVVAVAAMGAQVTGRTKPLGYLFCCFCPRKCWHQKKCLDVP